MSAQRRRAVLIPGRRFGPHSPLLTFAGRAASARGAELIALEWDDDELSTAERAGGSPAQWVGDRVRPHAPTPTGATSTLLVGKSLGSHGAAVAAERGLPAVWLTPLLHDPDVVSALRAATAPFLLIGGTADQDAWSSTIAAGLTAHHLSIPDADHGMFVPGPLSRSAAVLGVVITAIENFLDNSVWPTAEDLGHRPGPGAVR